MRVFITGATGFIGMAVTKELIAGGHKVIGLARSKEKSAALTAAGAEVLFGTIEDGDILKKGADRADGVIHTAFNHDFSTYLQNCEDDRRVIDSLGSVLVGSNRPLIVTSGTGIVPAHNGKPATEDDAPAPSSIVPRAASEEAANALADKGVNISIMRLPQVHDTERQGLVSYAIMVAQEKKVSAYVGEGRNRWPASHVSDTARLYKLALERAERGAKYHAVAEEGIALKQIAEVLGRKMKLPVKPLTPEEAGAHFGWLAIFAGTDAPASSAKTRQKLGWTPTGPGMIADLERMHFGA
jgi:nucleoside-diphosphate-sugar epimerase